MSSRRAQILVAVREMILRGELPPCKTIEEIELSRKLGASRPIVRATLEKLHQEGLLNNWPLAATHRVSSPHRILPTPSRLAAHWRVWQPVWQRGEPPIPHSSTVPAASMRNSQQATASFGADRSPTAEQMASFGELNLAFHQALIALAKSPMLQLSLDRVQSIAFASPAAVVIPSATGGFSQAVREHNAILDAIEAGDAGGAEKLVREHARFALQGMKSALKRQANCRAEAQSQLRGSKHPPPKTPRAGPNQPARPPNWCSTRPPRCFAKRDSRKPQRVKSPHD